ncbi:mechanosensitive ion channel [Mycoplasmatota bacterium WC44]
MFEIDIVEVQKITVALFKNVIFIIFLYMLLKQIIRFYVKRSRNSRKRTISKLLGSIVNYFIAIILVINISSLFIDTKAILASAGLLSLAIGFGSQDLVKDLVSGFFILFENHFNVGEVIEVDGFMGTVESFGLKSTEIKKWSGEIFVISNGDITKLINHSRNNIISTVEIGVDIDTDLNMLESDILVMLDKLPKKYSALLGAPQYLGVVNVENKQVVVRVIAETLPGNQYQIQRDIKKDLVNLFKDKGISFAINHVRLINE